MKQVGSILILVAVVALAAFSFMPEGRLTASVLWAALTLLAVAGGLIWLEGKRGRDD